MVAMGLALVGYVLLPTAPPRFFPELGFVDTIAYYVNVKHDSGLVALFFNPYAAVPSMHVAFALLISVPALLVVRSRVAKVLWALYPLRGRVRRDRDRQPLVHRRRRRGGRRRRLGAGRDARAARACGRLHGPGQRRRARRPPKRGFTTLHGDDGVKGWAHGAFGTGPFAGRPANGFQAGRALFVGPTAAELRENVRDRLIESRLTPNSISMTGPRAERRGSRARHAAPVLPRRRRVHRRQPDGHARRALLAHVRQGDAVRRLPRLHARPDRGGDRADGSRGLFRLARATSSRSPRRSWWCWAR